MSCHEGEASKAAHGSRHLGSLHAFYVSALGCNGDIHPGRRQSFELPGAVSMRRLSHDGPLSVSLFPETLPGAQGPITKPAGW